MRWQEFSFTVSYREGKEKSVADALWRISWPMQAVEGDAAGTCDDSDSDSDEKLNAVLPDRYSPAYA